MLINMTSTSFGRTIGSRHVFADHRSDSYRVNQVQTRTKLVLASTVVKRNIFNARRARHAAFLQDAPSELWQRRSLSAQLNAASGLLGRDEPPLGNKLTPATARYGALLPGL
ncbi:hypothetical protein [Mycobacterium shimoidei]|uniref:hypothetical protein n=1 Tax=Mycobacterium shimoidei TaxID=29313 RepID=UPI00111BFF74|nr:hypothetical protein [Mycobacterium shimoidei]MCV7258893.1 hypothetical protein [Mycobacterium shimoidei]